MGIVARDLLWTGPQLNDTMVSLRRVLIDSLIGPAAHARVGTLTHATHAALFITQQTWHRPGRRRSKAGAGWPGRSGAFPSGRCVHRSPSRLQQQQAAWLIDNLHGGGVEARG